jgi:pilus assembly protein CpaE
MLNETIDRLLGINAVTEKQGGLLVVFLSAKGGTGTSSMCANIAMNLAWNQPEIRVVVLDLILPIGSIAPIVGFVGTQNIVTITDMHPGETTPGFFRDELPEIQTWRFHLLAGSPDPESSNHLQLGRIWDIVKSLKESYDYVLIDLGRSLSKTSLPLIQHADLIALILGADISSVSLTRTLWLYLKGKGVDAASIYTILNRAAGSEGLSKVDAEKMIGIPINVTMPYLSSNMSFANSQHQPFTIKFPNDAASIVFQESGKEMSALARKLRAV